MAKRASFGVHFDVTDASGATESSFMPSFIQFLASGWMLALDSDRILVGWGEWSESPSPPAEPESSNSCAIFAPDFYLRDERPWKWTTNWDLLERDRFATFVLKADAAKVNSVAPHYMQGVAKNSETIQWLEPSPELFKQGWNAIRNGFEERGIQKAVPVVFAKSRLEFDLRRRLSMLKSLVAQPKHLYLYGMWSETSGMIGASPELLFKRSETGALETVALAGTRAKRTAITEVGTAANGGTGADENPAVALLKDPKERFEHQLVVDDIKDRLSQIGDVALGETRVLELPTLYHLKTELRAKPAKRLDFTDFVRLLHPTPALGVSPRAAGFEEMLRWDEPAARSRFGGPFGAHGPGIDQCIVAIRNVQWDGVEARLGSGCGVVGESIFEREWAELQLKRDSVKRMLDL